MFLKGMNPTIPMHSLGLGPASFQQIHCTPIFTHTTLGTIGVSRRGRVRDKERGRNLSQTDAVTGFYNFQFADAVP